MSDDLLTILGDGPLVFGIQCPWCDTEHYVASLGTKVKHSEDGEDVDVEPTLGLIDIDGETEIGTVKCWECHRIFRFHFCVVVPDEMFTTEVN